MRVSIWGLSGAVALLAVMTAGPLVAQQHGQHHGEDRDDMRGMHSEMMEDCPMAGHGMMMGEMMEGMEDLRELLTDEQMEMLREHQRSHMGEMHRRMHDGHDDHDHDDGERSHRHR